MSKETTGTILFVVGLIVLVAGVAGMEASVTDPVLIQATGVGIVGGLVMASGVLHWIEA